MTEDDYTEKLGDGEWVEILSSPAESKSWKPVQNEGSEMFVQIEQGKFYKYVFENGRYNLVGTVGRTGE